MTIESADLKAFDRRIAETLDVVYCRLKLTVDRTYKRARYHFSYKVRKKAKTENPGDDQWFGVIPYPTNQINELQCTKSSGDDIALHTLQDGRAILVIPFGSELEDGEEFTFLYSYHTRIESIVEDRIFRTSGNASYYIAHVSPCYDLQIQFSFDRANTRILRLHPNGEIEGDVIVFEKQNVSPMEFFVFNCLYETGLPKQWAYTLEHLMWILVGVICTLIVDWIIS